MAPETIEIKVQRLESQFLQLRTELRDEFSAVREESLARETRVVATLREEIHSTNGRTVTTLREEIRAGDEETRRFMRVLHAQVISDIATSARLVRRRGPSGPDQRSSPGRSGPAVDMPH